ncbi:hypothetical protein E9840_03775 [Tissierella creatinini]|nr:hypothetical protein E9840_03775 [Tissierella creatinini]TJX67411.1 hypothetical protein E8P77_05525 [Soehngenia saccharolytica]
MMKIKKSFVALSAAVVLLGSTYAFSEPGSESDPLVTLSYVNKSIDQLKSYIDEKLESKSKSSYELEIVDLKKGKFLIAKAGTEIILRGGKATAIVSELGGLQDITQGVDIGQGGEIPPYHLLLVPRNDGRGVYCTTDAIFMVRGDYEIR